MSATRHPVLAVNVRTLMEVTDAYVQVDSDLHLTKSLAKVSPLFLSYLDEIKLLRNLSFNLTKK